MIGTQVVSRTANLTYARQSMLLIAMVETHSLITRHNRTFLHEAKTVRTAPTALRIPSLRFLRRIWLHIFPRRPSALRFFTSFSKRSMLRRYSSMDSPGPTSCSTQPGVLPGDPAHSLAVLSLGLLISHAVFCHEIVENVPAPLLDNTINVNSELPPR